MPAPSPPTVRQYIRGWVLYHSDAEANLNDLTDRVCTEIISEPDTPLNSDIRDALRETLGTRDAKDTRTPPQIVFDLLRDYVSPERADHLSGPVTQTVLSTLDTGWQINADTPLPRALDESFESLVQEKLMRGEIDLSARDRSPSHRLSSRNLR